jgi:hypothetical protein
MKNNPPLDAECILIIGGQLATARAIACNLAVNGAIVFVSGDDEKTLTGYPDHIRAKVPGCSVTGAPGNTSSAAGIRNFLLQAEIALPMQGAVIHLPVLKITAHLKEICSWPENGCLTRWPITGGARLLMSVSAMPPDNT